MKRHKSAPCVVTLYLALLLIGAAVFSQQASAYQILVDAPSAGYYYYGMYSPYAIAASFTLTGSEYVSTIGVVLRTPSTTSFTTFDFSLQNSLTSPFTTFASAALTAPLGSVSTEIINVNKTLPAGTYYLLGIVPGYAGTPVTPGDVDGWMLSTGVYNNAAGTVTDGVWVTYDGSTWHLLSGDYFNNGTLYYAPAFSVNGTPTPPPPTQPRFPLDDSASYTFNMRMCDPNYPADGEHKGVDIMAEEGTNVYPICDGRVVGNYTDTESDKRYSTGKKCSSRPNYCQYFNSFLIIEHNCNGQTIFGYYGHIKSGLGEGTEVSVSDNLPIGQIRAAYNYNNIRNPSLDHLHLGINISQKTYDKQNWGIAPPHETCQSLEKKGWRDAIDYFGW